MLCTAATLGEGQSWGINPEKVSILNCQSNNFIIKEENVMANEVICVDNVSENVNSEIIDNACKFVNLLTSEEMAETRNKLTIIPNVLKEILALPLENKKLNIQNQNTLRKAELAKEYLSVFDKASARNHDIKLAQIKSEFAVVMSNIEKERRIKLAEIENSKQTSLRKIEMDERIELAKLQSYHDLELRKLEEKSNTFQKWLDESNKRFFAKINQHAKLQNEFTIIINHLISKSNLDESELKTVQMLINAKTNAMNNAFDLRSEFLDFFYKGEQ